MSPTTTRHAEPDQACADAVDLARQAVEDDAGADQVGEHEGIEVEGDRIVTHLFTCLSPAYVGWRWAVTVNRASRSKLVTVSECYLLPGPDALLAPAWVPWTERVRPGDLKAGDLMPASSDDERLVPLVVLVGEPGLLDWDERDPWSPGGELAGGELAGGAIPAEIGQLQLDTETEEPPLGEPDDQHPQSPRASFRRRAEAAVRPRRVLSAIGRDEAAVRWHLGDHGPNSALANAAPACCITCGFIVRLNGPLGRVFGVCANEFAPDDGRVVSVDHGCGAHSDGDVAPDATPPVDETGYDMLSSAASLPDSVLDNIDHELN